MTSPWQEKLMKRNRMFERFEQFGQRLRFIDGPEVLAVEDKDYPCSWVVRYSSEINDYAAERKKFEFEGRIYTIGDVFVTNMGTIRMFAS